MIDLFQFELALEAKIFETHYHPHVRFNDGEIQVEGFGPETFPHALDFVRRMAKKARETMSDVIYNLKQDPSLLTNKEDREFQAMMPNADSNYGLACTAVDVLESIVRGYNATRPRVEAMLATPRSPSHPLVAAVLEMRAIRPDFLKAVVVEPTIPVDESRAFEGTDPWTEEE